MSHKRLLALLIAVLFTSRSNSACSRIGLPPVEPNPELVAFDGVVTAHFAAKAIPRLEKPAPGLVVKIKNVISNHVLTAEVEVFPLIDQISCDPSPSDLGDIEKRYPVGAIVAVMGRLLSSMDSSRPQRAQMATWPSDLGGVARIPEGVSRLANGFLDFHAFSATYEPNSYDHLSPDVAWRNAHRDWFEDYEFLRCLIALQKGLRIEDSERLLNSMGHYLRYSGINGQLAREQYRALVKQAKVPRHDRKRLLMTFDRKTSPNPVS